MTLLVYLKTFSIDVNFFSKYTDTTKHNGENFINNLPESLNNKINSEDDVNFIHEVLINASKSTELHVKLQIILEKHLSSEEQTDKLKIQNLIILQ